MFELLLLVLLTTCSVKTLTFEVFNQLHFKTYSYDRTYRSYDEAIDFCESQSRRLIQIKSRSESEWIQKFMPFSPIAIIGTQRLPPEGNTTKWLDGCDITWYNWASKFEPGHGPGYCDFVALYPDMTWFAPVTVGGVCMFKALTLCEKSPLDGIKLESTSTADGHWAFFITAGILFMAVIIVSKRICFSRTQTRKSQKSVLV